MATTQTEPEILRTSAVIDKVGLSRSTLHRLRRAGEFPAAIQLSANAVGWRAADINEWLANRPAA